MDTNRSQRLDPTGDLRADMLAALEYGVHPMVRQTAPIRADHACDRCPRDFVTRAGLASHHRIAHS